MTITLAENLKKLRLARDLTQEELAQFLGVTSQAVSKWERREGYPDITMLPVIANYFEVTVDDLLGNDILAKEEKIRGYIEEYNRLHAERKIEEEAALAERAYREYPYDWRIAEIYIISRTRGFTRIPDSDTLAELRRLCGLIMEKCTDPIVRKRAIYSMIFAEDDGHVEQWFAQAPDNADYLESERREERYIDREQWELYYPQKQENMRDIFGSLFEKMGYYNDPCTQEWKAEVRKRRIALIEVLFTGTDRLLYQMYRGAWIEYAMALDECGQIDETICALSRAADLWEEQYRFAESLNVPHDAKVHLSDPMWDKLAYPAYPRKFHTRFVDSLAQRPEYAENLDFRNLMARIEPLR